nr:MarR family transcriptional regulator [uncultured Sphaerochaeta sp.]
MKDMIMPQISHLHLAWKRYLEAPLLREGLTIKQFYLLKRLKAKGALYPAEIAEMLFCDRPTVSVIISNMEKKSWISREKDEKDGRKWLIRLTDEGKSALESSLGIMNPLEIDPVETLSAEEVQLLNRLLGKIRIHLEEKL